MTVPKRGRSGQTLEQKPRLQELGINMRSYAAAEKGDEGMALKILTRAEDMPDVFFCIHDPTQNVKKYIGATCMEIPRQILSVV